MTANVAGAESNRDEASQVPTVINILLRWPGTIEDEILIFYILD